MDGIVFGSVWEQNVFAALIQLELDFRYQVPFFGGWLPGGLIVDFLVTVPGRLAQIALHVDGPHWHKTNRKKLEDALKRNRLTEVYGIENMVIDHESETPESALRWCKDNLK